VSFWRRLFSGEPVEELLERAYGLVEKGDYGAAADLVTRARLRHPQSAAVWVCAGEVALGLQDPREAIRWMQRALALDPAHFPARVGLARALLSAGRVHEAYAAAEVLRKEAPDAAEVAHLLATLCEIMGSDTRAWALYRRAAALDPTRFFVPIRVPRADFDAMVQSALDALSPEIQAALLNVVISVKDFPHPGDSGDEEWPIDPTNLGVILGAGRADRSVDDPLGGGLPCRICFFQRNHERGCRSRAELAHEVRVTVLHEVGHYLGLDEEDLLARGLD
jgi:predicted Zn-dependent protease with MMP-like domain